MNGEMTMMTCGCEQCKQDRKDCNIPDPPPTELQAALARIAELESQLAITQEAAKIDPSRRRADAALARVAELEGALTDIARLWPAGVAQHIAREALK